MAERRYGFRFSFAEGGVLVVGMIGAAFLIFLFGVYAGRELEARKNAKNTRTVRVNALERASDTTLEGMNEELIKKEEKTEPLSSPVATQEAVKTVVVVTPPKQNTQPAEPQAPLVSASSPIPPSASLEKEPLERTEVLQKRPPIVAKKVDPPPPSVTAVMREQRPSVKESSIPIPPAEKPRVTKGTWSVQVHATRDENSARRVAGRLRSQGYAPVVSKIVREGEVWYRVRVGSFRTADEARASVEHFRREGKFSQAYPVSN